MQEITQYLDFNQDNGAKPQYNIFKWQPSAVVAGSQTVVIGAKKGDLVSYVYIKKIWISNDGLGGIIAFRDTKNNTPIFNFINAVASNGMYDLPYVAKGFELTIVANSPTVQFSLGYVTVSQIRP